MELVIPTVSLILLTVVRMLGRVLIWALKELEALLRFCRAGLWDSLGRKVTGTTYDKLE